MFESQCKRYVNIINEGLERFLPKINGPHKRVRDAMRYSMMGGGKRIRPMLTLAVCEMLGSDAKKAIPFACAVEFVHVGSLIHDDLPCMDDDDLRRGKPSCHIEYDYTTAVLAGDAFFLSAFEVLTKAREAEISYEDIYKACDILSKRSAVDGMIGGQVIDIYTKKETVEEDIVELMHIYKTSALIQAASVLGGIAAHAKSDKLKTLDEYGKFLGLAFQACDDILDVSGKEEILGKPIGSDEEKGKINNITVFGLEGTKQIANKFTDLALNILQSFDNNQFLVELTKSLLYRNH